MFSVNNTLVAEVSACPAIYIIDHQGGFRVLHKMAVCVLALTWMLTAGADAENPTPAGVTDGLLKRIAAEKTVVLKEGTYCLDRTLVLTEKESGAVVKAAPGAKVVLSGGRRVTGWTEAGGGFWSASVPWVTDRVGGFHHIVVNGQNRDRAKAPNEGYFKAVDKRAPEYANVDWMGWEYTSHKHRVAIEKQDAHPDWDISNGDAIFYHFWNDSHAIPSSFEIDKDGNAWLKLSKSIRHSPCKALWRLENTREVCDLPGEWYFAFGEKRLYYRPCAGEDMRTAEVTVPSLVNLVRIEGAKNVRFEGVTFADTRFELPADDRNDQQAAYSTEAAIVLTGAQDCVFERCAVTRTDAYAFKVLDGSRGTRIRRCALEHIGAGGVHVTGGGCGWAFDTLTGEKFLTDELPDPKTIVSDTEISDCVIADYGRVFASGVGVLSRYAEKTAIVHNEIRGGYYSGVSVGWSWGYHFTGLGNNTISFNHISEIGRGVLSDMGAIYTLGVQPGTVIANNVIHGVDARVYGGWGLYNDEGSSGITVENNLVYDTKYAPYNLHYGHDLVVRNNILAGGANEQLSMALKEKCVSLAFYNNIVWWKTGKLMSGAWADSRTYDFRWCGNLMRPTQSRTQGCLMDYNVYFNPDKAVTNVVFGANYNYFDKGGWPTYKGESTFEEWKTKHGKDVHSVYEDPLFVDAEKKDFRLKPDSPACRLGFRPIDFSTVGPRKGFIDN